jgi:hypothetical protein
MSEVLEPTTAQAPAGVIVGQHCVVRTYSAGVHLGVVASRDGRAVLLTSARRLWTWRGAFTLSEVAMKGVTKGSRISVAVPTIELTEAIELIPTTEEARATFAAIHE